MKVEEHFNIKFPFIFFDFLSLIFNVNDKIKKFTASTDII